MNKLSNEKEEEIVKLLKSGLKSKDIGLIANVSHSSVWKISKRFNIKTPPRRRMVFNHDFFEKIDCDIKAYWLGVFFADGCAVEVPTRNGRKNSYKVTLAFTEGDKSHLEKFLNAIDFDFNHGKISMTKTNKSDKRTAQIFLTSKKMFDDLSRLGCVPRKTKVLMPPKINKKFHISFIRGFYDGDGGCSFSDKESLTFCVTFASTKPLLEFIAKTLDVPSFHISEKSNAPGIFSLHYSTRGAMKVLDKLYYQSSLVCMDRKIKKFKEFLILYMNRGRKNRERYGVNSKISNEEVISILKKFAPPEEVKIYLEK